eukprot:1376535-Rhodomonas_salina.2
MDASHALNLTSHLTLFSLSTSHLTLSTSRLTLSCYSLPLPIAPSDSSRRRDALDIDRRSRHHSSEYYSPGHSLVHRTSHTTAKHTVRRGKRGGDWMQ